jgi:phosphoglycerol transferase MdoB-like AlkP superfamily enzyme
MILLLDVAPVAGGIGIFAAAIFFLVFAAVAFFVFKMLKRTVKMAFRMAIVAVILAIAVAGSIALWAFGGGGSSERPRATRPR